jgi:hypothetical protein
MRQCGDCTKCCEGWLLGEAYGHKFWAGRPCYFMGKGKCTIYEKRPESPCKSYKCMWLIDENIPEWFKPNEINAIMSWREKDNIRYIELNEAGETLRSDVLSWTIQYVLNNNLNLLYKIKGGWNKIGQQDFLQANI